jgi:hypothetical protein
MGQTYGVSYIACRTNDFRGLGGCRSHYWFCGYSLGGVCRCDRIIRLYFKGVRPGSSKLWSRGHCIYSGKALIQLRTVR